MLITGLCSAAARLYLCCSCLPRTSTQPESTQLSNPRHFACELKQLSEPTATPNDAAPSTAPHTPASTATGKGFDSALNLPDTGADHLARISRIGCHRAAAVSLVQTAQCCPSKPTARNVTVVPACSLGALPARAPAGLALWYAIGSTSTSRPTGLAVGEAAAQRAPVRSSKLLANRRAPGGLVAAPSVVLATRHRAAARPPPC